eukprot:CAMPEP_0172842048 /NCGR_PEP_ID=MMETSP1075-20121228/30440_1 /TAXON_ID=2916 /ORGANISM="Ceratium fusus, Strain PA161109" /LENGTH=203 /DNA_ID=CAMNT_0013686107 /DNA_START=59 /DNA_END=670 /DNA_ORIENTATION=+
MKMNCACMLLAVICAGSASNAVAVLRAHSSVELRAAPKLSSFDISCYMEKDPAGESGGAGGRSYRGLVSTTVSGFTCQKWVDDKPHEVSDKIKPVPDRKSKEGMEWGNGIGNHNYCRNPTGKKRPWCYTTDLNKEWEECEIPKCDVPRDWTGEAKMLGREAEAVGCRCIEHLHGLSLDGASALAMLGVTKDGKPCRCETADHP